MKQKKYPKSKIDIAQKFLSKYELTFDNLNEKQKKIIISYTQLQKYKILCLVLFIFCLVIFSVGAYIIYQAASSGIDEISKMSVLENENSLRIYGESCFKWGFSAGLYSCTAFIMLIYIILILIGSRAKFQIINAFLPSLKHHSNNLNGLKGQTTLAQGNALGVKNNP